MFESATISRLFKVSPLLLALLTGCASAPKAGGADEAVDGSGMEHALVTATLPSDNTVAGLVERVAPSVVSITTTGHQAGPMGMLPPGFPEIFPQLPQMPQMPQQRPERRGAGSGFIVDADGYVVTNAHVVDGADEITVHLHDQRELSARVVGKDDKLDLALLKVDGAGKLPTVLLGDSNALRVGEHVIAMGNPFGLGDSVTLGIISGKTRSIGAGPYDAFLQTDASINPGNSGGPLFDLSGRVVGINTAIRPNANSIGFAIPVDDLKDVLPQLKQHGHVERGRLGLRFQEVSPAIARALGLDKARGALVSEVEPNSPAAQAGIREGDLILAVDADQLGEGQELARLVARHAPGSEVKITVRRQGEEKVLTATLGRLEDEASTTSQNQPSTPDRSPGTEVLGIHLRDTPQGVVVTGLDDGHHDLRVGDRIVAVDGVEVTSAADLGQRLGAKKPAVLLKVRRGDATLFVGVDTKG